LEPGSQLLSALAAIIGQAFTVGCFRIRLSDIKGKFKIPECLGYYVSTRVYEGFTPLKRDIKHRKGSTVPTV
jgi:hypothetical protein